MSATRTTVQGSELRTTDPGVSRNRLYCYIGGEGYRSEPAVRNHRSSVTSCLPVTAIATAVLDDGDDATPLLELVVVVSGQLIIPAGSHAVCAGRGDVLLVEGDPLPPDSVRHDTGTRLVGLRLSAPWPDITADPLDDSDPELTLARAPQLGVMRRAQDDLSYFADLKGFFSEHSVVWSTPRSTRGCSSSSSTTAA